MGGGNGESQIEHTLCVSLDVHHFSIPESNRLGSSSVAVISLSEMSRKAEQSHRPSVLLVP